MEKDCIFCRIADRTIAVEAIHEDALAIAFADRNPQAPTHLLVIPKRHLDQVEQGDAELLGHLMHTAAALGRRLLPEGHRIVVNTGADGGQTVSHLHLHLLGGRGMGWPPG